MYTKKRRRSSSGSYETAVTEINPYDLFKDLQCPGIPTIRTKLTQINKSFVDAKTIIKKNKDYIVYLKNQGDVLNAKIKNISNELSRMRKKVLKINNKCDLSTLNQVYNVKKSEVKTKRDLLTKIDPVIRNLKDENKKLQVIISRRMKLHELLEQCILQKKLRNRERAEQLWSRAIQSVRCQKK